MARSTITANGIQRLACLLALTMLAVGAGGAGGCALLAPQPGPQVRTAAGEVRMDWRSRRNLRVLQHRYWRQARGHLAVAVEFENFSAEVYVADLQVRFSDAHGVLDRWSQQTQERRFPPGRTALEWTSYTPEAAGYVVEVRSARLLQW